MTTDPAASTVEDLAAAIGAGPGPILLLTDLDGTLCELQHDPEAVFLTEPRRTALSWLASRPGFVVGLVSGRRSADLRRRTGLDGPVPYAGLHGMEIEGPDRRFEVPELGAREEELQRLGRALGAAIAPLPGALLENKGLSVAVHVRAAAPADRRRAAGRFWDIAGPALDAGQVRLQRGDCVFELLPDISWTKGDAVRWIEADVVRRLGTAAQPVYLGDDLTDEPAFDVVAARGIGIVVGERPSRAAHRLPDPAAVEQLLVELGGAPRAG